MHKIAFGDITRDFPESIAQMSVPQYRYFCFLELNRQSGKIKMADLETLFVYFVLGMTRTSKSLKVVENVTLLRKLVQPYFTVQKVNKESKKIVNLDFIKNPIPEITIKCNGKKMVLLGPAPALQNCSYEEVFVHGHNAMLDFANSMDAEALDRLVATLYRPAKESKRPLFDQDTYEDILHEVAKLEPEVKYGVYLFFASCHKFLTTHNALDIGGGNTINVAQLFNQDKNQNSIKGIGTIGIIFSLAKTNVFGNSRETGRANVIDVLALLVQLHEEAKELKRKYDKSKPVKRNPRRR